MKIIDKVTSPEAVKKLSKAELSVLAEEIRGFLIENVARTGGHLASNLGVVELSIALHRIYDTARDRVVFDVGHQSYVHKILTGRKDGFRGLRTLDGLSGFPKPKESIHDAAISGHASNSISVALGMARARTLRHEDYNVAAIIGDGALTGGLAYEGIINAGQSGEPMVVILNDNGMSIDSNVGSVSEMLSRLRLKPKYLDFKRLWRRVVGKCPRIYGVSHRLKEWLKSRLLPGNIFDDFGFMYLGPVDGHNISQLEAVLAWAKEQKSPVLVHVVTQKGRGYGFAEEKPEIYHGVGSFNADRGVDEEGGECFSAVFGRELSRLADSDESIAAITAAMSTGTGLADFAQSHPERFFDVGIAEGHAVSMSAGLAAMGMKPVFAVYSSFLQRAYDMLIHDVSLSRLHVVLAVDRAGLVGADGETHQGCFDVSFLCSVPGMTVLCPASYAELREMLKSALYKYDGPVAVRYPRGGEGEYKGSGGDEGAVCVKKGTDITIASYGTMINQALAAEKRLAERGVNAEIIKINRIKPLDAQEILRSVKKTGLLLTAEEVCAHGSIGTAILESCVGAGIFVKAAALDLGDGIVPQGKVSELLHRRGLDGEGIAAAAMELVSGAHAGNGEADEKAAT